MDKKEDPVRIDEFYGKKSIGLLLDPDKVGDKLLDELLKAATVNGVDYLLVGGSLTFNMVGHLLKYIKEKCSIPVILFPGNLLQLSDEADGVFLLSLISGRNPELLIGNHVLAAPFLKDIRKKLIPVGYILINCGSKTSVEYISQTEAIPADKPDIVVATALAGEMLGLKLIYLEGGSGALRPVDIKIIKAVRENISVPIIVGGGLRNGKQVEEAFMAGADLLIIGNGSEDNPGLITDACKIRDEIRKINRNSHI
jgi:phosphoglycerol geranylgeranyltransferase